jgi:hypothetical protein
MPDDSPVAFSVPQHLSRLGDLYRDRNAAYTNNYKWFGQVMLALFPNGLQLRTAEDFNRFGVFVQVVGKISRYAPRFHAGGHADSLDDVSVYAAMLRELDEDAILARAAQPRTSDEMAVAGPGVGAGAPEGPAAGEGPAAAIGASNGWPCPRCGVREPSMALCSHGPGCFFMTERREDEAA